MGAAMTREEVDKVLGRIKSWPFEHQAKLAELAELIEAQQQSAFPEDATTRAAVAEGLAQAQRGEFVSDEEVKAAFQRFKQ